MIHVLYGENEFEKRQALARILTDYTDAVVYSGDDLESIRLRELLQGQTLFTDRQTVVITGLGDVMELWTELPNLVFDAEGTTLILVETKLDKRTKTYKWLEKNAEIQEFKLFSERDRSAVVQWCVARAQEAHRVVLDRELARMVVERLGHDQLRIDNFLGQLSLTDQIDRELIDALLPMAKSESVFELLEAVVRRDRDTVRDIIRYLESNDGADGAYQTLGLLSSQLITLSALILGGSPSDVADDMGVHPFTVRKILPHADKVNAVRLRSMVKALTHADQQMKSSSVNPWLLLEVALADMMS